MTDISNDSIGSKQLVAKTMPSRETSILPIRGEAIEFIQQRGGRIQQMGIVFGTAHLIAESRKLLKKSR
jgi:hypothetical protein